MGFFSHDSDEYNQREEFLNNDFQPHQSSKVHELLAGGAAFEAMRLYEKREEREGKPQSHAFAKEIIAGLVGAEVDKLAETKGLDFVDREQAKRQARQRAETAYDQERM